MIKLTFSIAYALLLARWKQTLVAAIGVTFSITMFIALLGFMNGLNELLDGLVINRTPHISIYNEILPTENQPTDKYFFNDNIYNFISSKKPKNELSQIYNSGAIIQTLKSDNRVLGVSPKLTTQVFYNTGTIDISGIINGIDVIAENKLFTFSDYVIKGNSEDLKTVSNSIILGKGAADVLLVDIGDVIQVTSNKGEISQLKVVGIFQSGIKDIDKVQSYTSISTAQKLLGVSNNYITDIQIKLKNLNLAPQIAAEFRSTFNVDAIDIQTANAQYETGSSVRSLISYAVGITLLIVAGFGIYNILNMMIYEKMDTIAILKATGFSGKDVKRIFLAIALSIGFFGGSLGLLLGFLISLGIDQIPFITASLPTITTYPVSYNPAFYFIGGFFSLITTYFAGLFPARKASGIDPVIIIRGK